MQTDAQKKRNLAMAMQDRGDEILVKLIYASERGREIRVVSPEKFDSDKVRCMCLSDGKPKWFILDKIEATEIVQMHEYMIPWPIERLWLPVGHRRRFFTPKDLQ